MRPLILIVDDDASNLAALDSLLQAHYDVVAAPSGALALLEIAGGARPPDLILLDVLMPEMDGFQVLTRLQGLPGTQHIPVIFVTGLDAIEDEARGLRLGAVDYIAKPYRPAIILARVRTQLELKYARDRLASQNADLEAEVAKRTREILLIQDVTINALAELSETRDPETGGHIRRTQEYVRILARRLRSHPRFSGFLNDNTIELLAKSAPLHDIGKVGIPDRILLKPGKLTEDEWAIMKTHSLLGTLAIERAIRDVDPQNGRDVDFLDIAKQITHFHHENWDGSGYPEGRQGDAIPIPARLMAVADVFDALISHRVYKPAIPVPQARDIIAGERGSRFDPDVVDAFIDEFDEFAEIADTYREGSRQQAQPAAGAATQSERAAAT